MRERERERERERGGNWKMHWITIPGKWWGEKENEDTHNSTCGWVGSII